MRRSIRSVLVALVVVMAFGAVATSGASATGFRIEGKPLTGTEAFASGTEGVAKVHFAIGAENINFECKQSSMAGTLETGAKWQSEVVFRECAMTEPVTCKLSRADENEIRLHTIGLLESTTAVDNRGSLAPSEEIFTYEIEGCALTGAYSVTGYWKCRLPKAGEELVRHDEQCQKSEGHLRTGGIEGNLSYTASLIKLASGKEWGVE